jgi:hypothetical protein
MPWLGDEGKIDSISSEVSHNFCFCFTLLSLLIVWTVSRIESTYLDLDFTRRSEGPASNSLYSREGGQDRMGENLSTAVADLVVKLHSNIDSIH